MIQVRCPMKGCGRVVADIVTTDRDFINIRPRRVSAENAFAPGGREWFGEPTEEELRKLWRFRRPTVDDEGGLPLVCEEHQAATVLRLWWRDLAEALDEGRAELVATAEARR